MSNAIEQRILEMQFNNKDFEKNVKNTMTSLKDLKTNLNMEGVTKGLSTLSTVGSKFNLSNLNSSLKESTGGFTIMGAAAMGVIFNLTNAVINFAQTTARSLTIQPILDGLGEYETKINSVQTIMANTSMDNVKLSEVNAALAELNVYADKTVYNFAQMTDGVSKFTAAGIKLPMAVASIKGIANLGALSGSSNAQVAGAFVQISQAMSKGIVQLEDWNSIQQSAGMGGKVFQQVLLDVAKAQGVNAEAMVKESGSFNASLDKKWLTTSVLTSALQIMTGDLSEAEIKALGHTKAAQTDYVLFTQTQMKAIALTSQQMQALKVNETTATAIGANFSEAQLKKAGLTADQIGLVVKYTKEGTASLTSMSNAGGGFTDDQVKNFQKIGQTANDAATQIKTFSGLMDVLKQAIVADWAKSWTLVFGDFDQARALFTEVSNMIGPIVSGFGTARNDILSGWNALGGREALIGALRAGFQAFMNIANALGEVLSTLFPPVTAGQLYNLSVTIMKMAYAFKFATEDAAPLKRIFVGLASIFQIIGSLIGAIVGGVLQLIGFLTGGVAKGFDLSAKGIIGFIANIADYLTGFKQMLEANKVFEKAVQAVGGALLIAYKWLMDWIEYLKPTFQQINDFLYGIRMQIEGFLKTLSPSFANVLAEFNRLGGGMPGVIGVLSKGFSKLKGFISEQFSKIDTGNFAAIFDPIVTKFKLMWEGIKWVAKGIGDTIDFLKERFMPLAPVSDAIGRSVSKNFGEMSENVSKKTDIKALLAPWLAGGLLAGIIVVIKKFIEGGKGVIKSFESIKEILTSVGGVLGAWQKNIQADTLKKIAVSVAILAVSLIALTFVDPVKLLFATGAITTMFADLMGSMAIMGKINTANSTKLAGTLLGMAAAVALLSIPVLILGNMDQAKLGQGMLAIGGIMAGLTAFMAVAKNAKFSASAGLGIMGIAIAINILVGAIALFGLMPEKMLQKGLLTVGALLLGLGLFTKFSGNGKNMIGTGIGITLIAGAMYLLAGVIAIFGSMDLKMLGIGLATIGVLLLEFGIALNAMQNALPGAAALLVAALAIGVLAPALFLLSKADPIMLAVVVVAIGALFAVLAAATFVLGPVVFVLLGVVGALALLGVAIGLIGVGILSFAIGMTMLAAMAAGIGAILAMAASSLAANAFVIKEAFIAILKTMLDGWNVAVPMFLEAVVTLIDSILDVIDKNALRLIEKGVTILVKLLEGLASDAWRIVASAVAFVVSFVNALASNLAPLVDAALNFITQLLIAIGKAIEERAPEFLKVAWEFAKSFVENLVTGIYNNVSQVIHALQDIIKNAISAAIAWLTGRKDPNAPQDLGNKIPDAIGDGIRSGTKDLKRTAVATLGSALAQIADSVNQNFDMTPTIRPVIDLSDVRAGAQKFGTLFGDKNLNVGFVADRMPSVQGRNDNNYPTATVDSNGNQNGSVISLTQNINAPTAPSAYELYKYNQRTIATLKGILP